MSTYNTIIGSIRERGLSTLKKFAGESTLTYVSGSTPLSASVFSSYGKRVLHRREETGTEREFLDLSVIVPPEEYDNVIGWGLEQLKSQVTLDGTAYMVGGVITTTKDDLIITLRVKNDVI